MSSSKMSKNFPEIISSPLKGVPPEIWTIIFEHLWDDHPKDMVGLRLVCKPWRDVIDNNLLFEITLDDRFDTSYLSHLRVKYCCTANLKTPLPPNKSIFSDPTLVTKLSITEKFYDGSITRDNFWILLTQFSNLKHLRVGSGCLRVPNLCIPLTQTENSTMSSLLGSLKIMKLAGIDVDPNMRKGRDSTALNFLQVMKTSMPNLKYLYLEFFNFNIDDSALLPFLMGHAPKLENLKVVCMEEYQSTKLFIPPVDLELNPLQLRVINLELQTGYFATNWKSILPLQRSLEKLRIKPWPNAYDSHDRTLQFADLEPTLSLNKDTLTSIELFNVTLSSPLKDELFGGMKSLKSLSLLLANPTTETFNLSTLPSTITKIHLQGFSFGNNVVKYNPLKFENLTDLCITRICVKPDYQSQDFLQLMATEMPNLKRLMILFDQFNLQDSGLLPFLVEKRAPHLEKLQIGSITEYKSTILDNKPVGNLDSNGQLHLTELDLTLTEYCWVENWLPIIKLQRELQVFRIHHRRDDTFFDHEIRPNDCFKFDELIEVLELNKKTLKVIKLDVVKYSRDFDLAMFREMDKLEELTLCHFPSSLEEAGLKMFNLDVYPASMRDLKLKGFHLDQKEKAKAEAYMESVKHVATHQKLSSFSRYGPA